jgi:nucleoside-diphosphate-sugar epimerase
MANILIIGCGYIGTALGQALLAADHQVWGLRRNPSALPEGFQRIACDLQNLADLPLDFQADYVFFMPSAGLYDLKTYQAVYKQGAENLLTCLQRNKILPKRLFYISSTSVYNQNNGAWVDETTPTKAANPCAEQLLLGEQAFLSSPFSTTIVRFGGIYGPGRNYFLKQVMAGNIMYSKEPLYMNHIHQKDCVGILQFLSQQANPESLYLGVDSAPTLKNTVIDWIREHYQLPPPEKTGASSPQEQRMRSHKRCTNKRILAAGYTFHYPSFREGYLASETPSPFCLP